MMKRLLLLITILVIVLASCKTKKERSRQLLEKANRLYPIEMMKDTLVKIDTVLIIDTFIVVKKDSIFLKTKIEKENNGVFKTFKNKLLLDNIKAKVYGSLDYLGNLSIFVELKEKKVPVTIKYRFINQVIAKKMYYKSPPEEIKVRGFIWWLGLVTLIAGICFGLFKLYIGYGTRIFKR